MEMQRARRRVRLRDLDTLMTVVQAGGMRRAAQVLNLSQPAVSKAVRELEQTLGVRLLERSRAGTEVTPFGRALLARSTAVFDQLQAALHEIEHLADPEAGEVRLGSMETLHAGLVAATVERISRRYPRMRIVAESGQSPDLIEGMLLRDRSVEFVVARPYALPLPVGVAGEPLFRDQMRVVVGHTHPQALRRRIGLAELAGEAWILSRNEALAASPVAEAFDALGLPLPARRVICGSLAMRYTLLATGRFVTVMPHSMLPFALHRDNVRLLPIDLPLWHTHTMVLTLKDRTPGPAACLFLDQMRELARQLTASAR